MPLDTSPNATADGRPLTAAKISIRASCESSRIYAIHSRSSRAARMILGL